jgi:hypothetical protein
MKKSFIVLIIVIQIIALFVFENMYSLFKDLERSEIAGIIAASELQAELHVLKIQRRSLLPEQPGYFDQVLAASGGEDSRQIVTSGKDQVLLVKKRIAAGSSLLFKKTIRSAQLEAFRSVIKILAGLTVFLGIFIVACGIYLAVLLRRKDPAKNTETISPLQDYLLEIKKSELELKDQVAAQSKSSVKIEELKYSIPRPRNISPAAMPPRKTIPWPKFCASSLSFSPLSAPAGKKVPPKWKAPGAFFLPMWSRWGRPAVWW